MKQGRFAARIQAVLGLFLLLPVGAAAQKTESASKLPLDRTDSSLAWEKAAREANHPVWKVVFFEQAYRSYLGPRGEAPRPEELPVALSLAAEWLEAALDVGLAKEAVAAFHSLPAAVSELIADGKVPAVRTELSGQPFECESRDLRRPLAAAAVLAGDRETAETLLAGFTVRPGGRDPSAEILDRSLHPTAEDPFELLTSTLVDRAHEATSTILDLAFAHFAEREGYPAFASYFWKQVDQRLTLPRDPWQFMVPPSVAVVAHRLEGEIAELGREAAQGRRAEQEADRGAALLARRLAAPPSPSFTEHPLPAGSEPVVPPARGEILQQATAAGWQPRQGFEPIRVGRDGERVAVLARAAEDSAPTGDYWVFLSQDRGRSWSGPLATGLRDQPPYQVPEGSKLPLLAGDRLQVEAALSEIDSSIIYVSSCASSPTKTTGKRVSLEIPLADLTRDSDGDGLTDLAEERLLTDPHDPDSDGDGIPDGADSLPQVARSPEAAGTAGAAAALLGEVFHWRPYPSTAFLVAPRAPFAGLSLTPDRRVILLTKEEKDAAAKRFGWFCPPEVTLFAFDRTGHRAFAIWAGHSDGGQLRLEWKDGKWTAKSINNWIS